MQDPMLQYFAGERSESVLFLLAGVGAIGASLYLWKAGATYKSMAYPLTAVALIQLAVGASIFVRTPGQVARLTHERQLTPGSFQQSELRRMHAVLRNFRIYKTIEIGLLLIGLSLTYFMRASSLWQGVAVGLMIQSGLMLVFDLFAEKRAKAYVNYLRSLS